MLDLKFVRKNPEAVREACARRRAKVDMDAFLALDERRRELIGEGEALKAERNAVSKEIGKAKKAGGDASAEIARMNEVGERIKGIDEELRGVDEQVKDWLLSVPNIPHGDVPDGVDDSDNPEVSRWGRKPEFDFAPKEHWELGSALGGLDFETGAKLAGSRFVVYKGWAARMERALAAFMLDVQTQDHGYFEVMPPVIVNRETMTATGQLPKFEEDLFKLSGLGDRDFYLIPTAEVPVTNLHRDETLDADTLPRKYAGWTSCFRSEAGSYGKDTKGLIRMHQFQKVEMVRIERPEDSYAALEQMRDNAEEILRRLGLHYRVVTLCTGDLGFSATKTYDIEVWLPGQDKFREISSCSNCEDFQARRGGIRIKRKDMKKPELAHTLNGSGLAVGRTLVAVLENYQRADGGIDIPEVLRPYMGGMEAILPE